MTWLVMLAGVVAFGWLVRSVVSSVSRDDEGDQ